MNPLSVAHFVLANTAYLGMLAGICALLWVGIHVHRRVYARLRLQPRMTTVVFGPAYGFGPAGGILAATFLIAAWVGRTAAPDVAAFALVAAWVCGTIAALGQVGFRTCRALGLSNRVPVWDIRGAENPELSPNRLARQTWSALHNLWSAAALLVVMVVMLNVQDRPAPWFGSAFLLMLILAVFGIVSLRRSMARRTQA